MTTFVGASEGPFVDGVSNGELAGYLNLGGSFFGSPRQGQSTGETARKTASVVDDTPSIFGGDKFKNGASTGAFSRLFNDVGHHRELEASRKAHHYACNAENDAYLREIGLYGRNDLTISGINDAGEFGFKQASDSENYYHRNGPGNENNIKFTSKVAVNESWFQRNFSNRYGRYELIVRLNGDGTFTHVADSINMSTLNRGNNPITHYLDDVIPYLNYGNIPN